MRSISIIYNKKLVRTCIDFGFKVIINPYQDL